MQDSPAEITRLMGCVAMSLEKLSGLQWDKAYFLNPIAYFSSVVSVSILSYKSINLFCPLSSAKELFGT